MTAIEEQLQEARLEIETLKAELVDVRSKSAAALEEALCRVHVLRAVLYKGGPK